MVIVPIGTAYVDANFKESQFGDIRIGQPVELTSDYYGGDVVYRGKVVGIAGGTGAAFSLIPAQDATGNWEIGRAHVCTPVTTAHRVCRLLLAKKNIPNTK